MKKKWGKEWREKNQDKVKGYEANRVRVADKEYQKEYYQKNKDYLKEKSRKRYQYKNENKDS